MGAGRGRGHRGAALGLRLGSAAVRRGRDPRGHGPAGADAGGAAARRRLRRGRHLAHDPRLHALARPSDWPTSFSVVSRDEQGPRDVLVRLRAYPEGKARDYLGERYVERPTFVEPYARDDAELCASPPELALGQENHAPARPDTSPRARLSDACPYVTRVRRRRGAGGRPRARRLPLRGDARHHRPVEPVLAQDLRRPRERGRLRLESEHDLAAARLHRGAGARGVHARRQSSLPFAPSDVTLRAARADLWADAAPIPPSPLPTSSLDWSWMAGT